MNSIRFVSIRLVSIRFVSIRFVEYTNCEYTNREYTFCKCIHSLLQEEKKLFSLILITVEKCARRI
jgi:hypothetical protein